MLNYVLFKIEKKKKIEKLKLNGLSLFIDKSYFSNDGSQNFIIF